MSCCILWVVYQQDLEGLDVNSCEKMVRFWLDALVFFVQTLGFYAPTDVVLDG